MGSTLRPGQWLEEEQHQREELWAHDSQLQSSLPLPPLPGDCNKTAYLQLRGTESQ